MGSGEDPVRGRRVVLERGTRLPVATPLPEPGQPRVAVIPLERLNGRVREAGRVEHHLLHRDDVLAFGAELGDVLGDRRGVDRALPDQDPHRARDNGLGRREDDVARVGFGVAQGHRRRDPAFAGDRELARREDAGVDVRLRPRDERGERLLVDSELRGTTGGGCVQGRHSGRP